MGEAGDMDLKSWTIFSQRKRVSPWTMMLSEDPWGSSSNKPKGAAALVRSEVDDMNL